MGSQWFGICLPAQLMMCVTLFATTNSRSYDHHYHLAKKWSYLGRELVPNEEPVFDLNRTDHVIVEDLLLLLEVGWLRRRVLSLKSEHRAVVHSSLIRYIIQLVS